VDRLERKKLELQLMKVHTAMAELEYRIEERKEDIKRMEDHIDLQKEQELKIKQELEISKNKEE